VERLSNKDDDNTLTMFIVLLLWQSHCNSAPGLFDRADDIGTYMSQVIGLLALTFENLH